VGVGEGDRGKRAYLGRRTRLSRERVPTNVQRLPQAPSEPSGAGGPARGAARRALLALHKPVGKTRTDHWRPPGARRIQVSRSRRPGRGGLGWNRRGRNPGPGCLWFRSSADTRRKLHESCPLRLLRSPPGAGPRPLLPRRAGLGRGTHPRLARLPGCPAARLRGAGSRLPAPGSRRAHTLPLRSNLQASMAGRTRKVAGRARAVRRARGPGDGARLGGQLPARLGSSGRAQRERSGCSACPRRRCHRSARCRRSATMWSCLGAEASRARCSPSLSLTRRAPASHPLSRDVSPGGRG
jgi:hypothetical protein